MIVRWLARPLLAATFVWSGVETLRHPAARAKTAGPFLQQLVSRFGDALPEQVPTDPETLVKMDAALRVGAGLGLAAGKFPRLSALLLAASSVPSMMVEYPFWKQEDSLARNVQRVQFFKEVGLVGGLLIAAVSPGKSKVARARRASK